MIFSRCGSLHFFVGALQNTHLAVDQILNCSWGNTASQASGIPTESDGIGLQTEKPQHSMVYHRFLVKMAINCGLHQSFSSQKKWLHSRLKLIDPKGPVPRTKLCWTVSNCPLDPPRQLGSHHVPPDFSMLAHPIDKAGKMPSPTVVQCLDYECHSSY